MNFDFQVSSHFSEHQNVTISTLSKCKNDILEVSQLLVKTLTSNNTVFWCGNGGSASDSQHLSAELIGRFINDRPPFRSISLNTDTSAITCISNDYCYDNVFARQVQGLGKKNDLLVCISTSGNSTNLINATKIARKLNLKTVGLLGKHGGALKHITDSCIIVPSSTTARIQEMHILIGHILCDLVEKNLVLPDQP